jgi:hypothetical protein
MPARPILLVEDNTMDIDLAIQAFEEGLVTNPVIVCRDGDEALAYMSAHSSPLDPELPIVVLLDLKLRRVDGLDVLRAAREQPTWKQIPFVVLTTSEQDSDISQAYELGVNSYIVKPVSFPAFAAVVQNIKAYWILTNQGPFSNGRKGRTQ